MLNKVIVILFVCSKLDYTTPLPDIIRIGEDFSSLEFFVEDENPFMQHRVPRKALA